MIHDIHPSPAGAVEVALNRGLLWISEGRQ
jgi:hypothetical protein